MHFKITFPVEHKGGPGSGHHGHAGIPGHHGGSAPGTGGSNSSIPSLSQDNGKATMKFIKEELQSAGLGRHSNFSGGEITGITNSYGSTGFSVRKMDDGNLDFHIVVSGKKAGLQYRDYSEWTDGEENTFSKPVNMQLLNPRINKVFTDIGLDVVSVKGTGYQTMWDDDVEYNIVTKPF